MNSMYLMPAALILLGIWNLFINTRRSIQRPTWMRIMFLVLGAGMVVAGIVLLIVALMQQE
ncbi:MAG: hypothetical protein ACLFVU_07200 [Phycisphaerae bacterium]